MDKSLREEENQNENKINEDEKEKETKSGDIKKDDKKYINVDVDEKEINFFKEKLKIQQIYQMTKTVRRFSNQRFNIIQKFI